MEVVVFENEDIITTSQIIGGLTPTPPVETTPIPPTYDVEEDEDEDNMTDIIM